MKKNEIYDYQCDFDDGNIFEATDITIIKQNGNYFSRNIEILNIKSFRSLPNTKDYYNDKDKVQKWAYCS